MSDKPFHFPYVMVEKGQEGTLSNNLLPEPIHLTTGEAHYTNTELESLNCTQFYVKLEEDACEIQE